MTESEGWEDPDSHPSTQVGRGREFGDLGLPAAVAREEKEGLLGLEWVKASQGSQLSRRTSA